MRSIVRRLHKLLSSAVTPAYWTGMRYGVFPSLEHGPALKSLPIKTVIDVGSNRGQFALLMRRLHPEARVFAFDALAEASSTFERVFREDQMVQIRRTALGGSTGEVELHISNMDDSSSLLDATQTQTETFPGTHMIGRRTVPIKPLSDCLDRKQLQDPTLLKIDVQGTELEVLRGAEALLPDIRYVCVEVSFVELYRRQTLAGEVFEFLQQRGFGIRSVYNVLQDPAGRSIQSDVLFESRAKSAANPRS